MQTSMRRRIALVALAVLVAFGCGALTALAQEQTAEGQTAYAAQQGTWKKSSGKWWYAYNGGGYAKSGWAQIDGKWYLFDGAGWMKRPAGSRSAANGITFPVRALCRPVGSKMARPGTT